MCVLFPLFFVGSFLVGTTQFASWGSMSFVSVWSARRHRHVSDDVSMTSPEYGNNFWVSIIGWFECNNSLYSSLFGYIDQDS